MLHHEIFRPSESWIHKSGVKLEYTPEDTLKSFIIPSGRALTNPLEFDDRDSCYKDGEENGFGKPTDIYVPEKANDGDIVNFVKYTRENSEVSSSKNKCEAEIPSIPKNGHHQQNQRKLAQLKKPTTFLRRRQGMAAWCSKIKRQGMPVKDPSEDLRKRQVPEQSNVPVRNAAIEINQADKVACSISTDILQPSRSQSVTDNRKLAIKGITGGFLCGLMHRRRSTSPSRGPTGNTAVTESGTLPNICVTRKNSAGSSQPQTTVSSLTDNSIRKHHSAISSTHSSDGSVRDAMDLQEFELLEEIVENHSLSSLSSLFASRISDKMRRIEEQVHEGTHSDSSSVNATNGESLQAHGIPPLHSSQVPETSILSVVEKHCTQAHSDQVTNPHEPNRYSHEMPTREPRKVTRFRLDGEGFDYLDAEYPGGRSPQTHRSVDRVLPGTASDTLPQAEGNRVSKPDVDELTDKEDNFDDANSWTGGSATDLNRLTSGSRQTVIKRIYASESQQSGECFGAKAGTSAEIMGSPVNNVTDLAATLAKTSMTTGGSGYLSTSAGAPAVDTSSPQGPSEERMASLADELVEQLKREAPALGNRRQSNTTTILRQWISRLESEVKRFKQENATVTKLKAEHEENLRKLSLDAKRFEEAKLKELKAFDEYKEAEIRKLKKERKVLDDYQRALKSMPSKKDREEIDRLKEELTESHADASRRDARWQAAVGRLRTRLEEVETEGTELRDRVRRLEEERVGLQARLAAGSAPTEGLAGPSLLRQTVTSLTQSVSLKPPDLASISSDPTNAERSRRALQQQQQLSSCRLSSRTTAIHRMRATSSTTAGAGLRKSLLEQQQQRWSPLRQVPQRRSSSSNQGRGGRGTAVPHGGGDHTGVQGRGRRSSRSPPRGPPPGPASARESVVSGSTGYHTGADDDDDDGGDSERSLMELLSTAATAPVTMVTATTTNDLVDAATVGKQSVSQQLNQGDEVSDREYGSRLHTDNPHPLSSARCPLTEKVASTELLERTTFEKLPVPGTAASGAVVRMVKHANGSTEHTYRNGAVVICYANGSVKEIFSDSVTTVVSLFNGDIKRTLPDGRVIYHYATDGTVQTTYPDGSETIEYTDGRQEVMHPTEALPSGSGQSVVDHLADVEQPQEDQQSQQLVRHLPNGDKEIQLPNGQREIHSVTGIKCRIYPDGTTKTVFPDGRHETRYASGRLRIRDVHGNLMLDTRLPVPHRLISSTSGPLSAMPSPPER